MKEITRTAWKRPPITFSVGLMAPWKTGMTFGRWLSRSCSITWTITAARRVRFTMITAKAFSPANFWFGPIKLRLNYGPRYQYTRLYRGRAACAPHHHVHARASRAVNRCTYIRALVENDYVVNEREAAWRTRHGENGQNVSFSAVLLFHFNGTVGSAGTLMPGWVSWCRRSRATATGQADARETKRPVRG